MGQHPATPKRFHLATLLAAVGGYMVLFGFMRVLDFSPLAFLGVAGLFTCVGIARVLLSDRLHAIAAATVAGGVYVAVVCGILFVLDALFMNFNFSAWMAIYLRPLVIESARGAIAGFFAYHFIDAYFFVLRCVLSIFGWELPERPRGPVYVGRKGIERDDDVKIGLPEAHPLDRE